MTLPHKHTYTYEKSMPIYAHTSARSKVHASTQHCTFHHLSRPPSCPRLSTQTPINVHAQHWTGDGAHAALGPHICKRMGLPTASLGGIRGSPLMVDEWVVNFEKPSKIHTKLRNSQGKSQGTWYSFLILLIFTHIEGMAPKVCEKDELDFVATRFNH